MQEQFEAGVIIEAPVIDHNKGGLIVDCGIRGFVPISQIVDFPRRPQNDQPRDAAQEIAEKLQPFVGRKLRLKILEVNRKANRLILSEKVALYEERREKRDELFSSLQVGQKVTGTVRSIAPFGVFIDLGGIDGLVHKSELSWNKVNNPEAGYKVGDEVEAEVIDINHERGRISLSIRRLQPDPWHSTVADFKVGDVIDGTVTKLVNFGAFVRVRDGPRGPDPHQRAVPPARRPSGRRRPRGPDAQAEDHLARLRAASPRAQPEAGRGAAGPARAGARRRPGAASAARERRPRPERGWSASDAVQEPEGGIDNTLAAAFAQVRDQLAASEEARVAVRGPGEAETAEATAEPDTAEAAAEPVEATAEPRNGRGSRGAGRRGRAGSSRGARGGGRDGDRRCRSRGRRGDRRPGRWRAGHGRSRHGRGRSGDRGGRDGDRRERADAERTARRRRRARAGRGGRAREPLPEAPEATEPEAATRRGGDRGAGSGRRGREALGLTGTKPEQTTRRTPAGRFDLGRRHRSPARRFGPRRRREHQTRNPWSRTAPDHPVPGWLHRPVVGSGLRASMASGAHPERSQGNRRSTRWTASTSSRIARARS